MKKNSNGFTLIELIAVIVMMGMILLVVFPAMSRLLKSNEEKKFDSYYESVQEAIELYARTRRDELGGIDGSGCVDDKKLSELKAYDYINEYSDEQNVTCLSPGDFTSSRLMALGIDTNKEYVNVRINNNKGKISVEYSMICVRNYSDPSTTSLLYSNLVERVGICETYVSTNTNSLYNEISGKYTTTKVGNVNYVGGTPNNNYVWYSGKLWRIISFDEVDKTIKLVANRGVTTISYNNIVEGPNQSNDYSTSNIYYWLNNKFLPTLKNPEKYLEDYSWNYSGNDESAPPTSGETITSKVGMINRYEFSTAINYIDSTERFWSISQSALLSNTTGYQFYNNDISNMPVFMYVGVRPSIVLKPNVSYIYGGNGTANNPYKLVGDSSGNIGDLLNSRFVGEYVSLNNILYRISFIDANYTKLTAVNTIPIDQTIASAIENIQSSDYNTSNNTIKFHYADDKYSDDTFIGNYLRIWALPIEDMLTEGDFCRMPANNATTQSVQCPQESIINTKVAIPAVGDMFAVGSDRNYWTMSNYEDLKINVVKPLSELVSTDISSQAAILPVIVVKNSAIITGGNGTRTVPYTIE